MSRENTADVIIVGGGVVGNAAAWYLATKGLSVILLECHEIGDGGSSRNGGGVRQSARDPKELPLAMYGVKHIWPFLSDELGVDTEYMQAGNLKFAKTQKHWDYYEGVIEQNRAGGLDIEMLDQKQTREICPYAADDVIGACFCRTDGHANPLTTTLGFYKRGRELGVRHITGEKAAEVLMAKGKAVGIRTEKGNTYYSGTVIIAAGYETRELTDPLGIDIPMRHKLIECMVIEMQPEMIPMMLRHARMEIEYKGETTAMREMRRHAAWYTAGYRNSSKLRGRIQEVCSYRELEALFENLLDKKE